jgi:hypothetical protein
MELLKVHYDTSIGGEIFSGSLGLKRSSTAQSETKGSSVEDEVWQTEGTGAWVESWGSSKYGLATHVTSSLYSAVILSEAKCTGLWCDPLLSTIFGHLRSTVNNTWEVNSRIS